MNAMLEKYFSPGPELLFPFIEQEHGKGDTSHIVSIQSALDCFLVGSLQHCLQSQLG